MEVGMTRNQIFDAVKAKGCEFADGAELHLDATIERAFGMWVTMGSPAWAKIEISGGQQDAKIDIGPLYGYVQPAPPPPPPARQEVTEEVPMPRMKGGYGLPPYTHPICQSCFARLTNLGKTKAKETEPRTCCYCRRSTTHGLTMSDPPENMACLGNHEREPTP
jgi:hypothetical protein